VSVIERTEKSEWDIVLAEDNDDHALLIEMALERAVDVPVVIRRARNGEEAVELINEAPPDLLLLDLKMPGMAGHEVLEEIKGSDRLRSIPVAVLTSSDRDEDMAKSYGLGGNHFITKPESPAELEEKLRALLRNLTELKGIRRGSSGTSTTAVSAVDPEAMLTSNVVRWVVVGAVLVALYLFGKFSGAL
jgi:two-component system phosphate regulon response regulator PhoB